MIDYNSIINSFYKEGENPELRNILLKHSRCVADLALKVCQCHRELGADEDFVYGAAMLHDIGIIKCDAPGIYCFGKEPYLCHGVLGAEMLRSYSPSLEPYARVCARHTGTGLTVETIIERGLPLPHQDLVPETLEEQIICYADKFFSKTHLDEQKTYEQASASLAKFGEHGLQVFSRWHEMFGV